MSKVRIALSASYGKENHDAARPQQTAFTMRRAAALTPALAAILLLAACVTPPRPAVPEAGTVALRVANESRERVVVYISRDESTPERLGMVNALATRSFTVPLVNVLHARIRLYSVPLGEARLDAAAHTTMPFRLAGADAVEWQIQDGRRLSTVTLQQPHR